MAKKKQGDDGKPNKSEAIRQVLAEKPDAAPKAVADIVNERFGHGVTAQYVSVVKSQDRKKSGKGPARQTRTRTAAARSTRAAAPSGLDAFDAAIGLVEAAGGLDQARAVLDRLESLRSKL